MSSRSDYARQCAAVETVLAQDVLDARGRVLCPFCVSSKTGRADRSLHFSPNGFYYCFRCGTKGKLRGYSDDLPRDAPEADPGLRALPEEFFPLADEPAVSAVAFDPARAYLARRGVSPATVVRFGIGGVVEGRYAGRVLVPLEPPYGALGCHKGDRGTLDVPTSPSGTVGPTTGGFVARDWTGRAGRPYLYPAGMSRERLYLHSALAVRTDVPVLVVEGVFDALAHVGEDGCAAVALLGKPTHAQILALRATVRPVVVVLDGDAWSESWALCARLRFEGGRAGCVRLPPRTDPDEVPHGWLIEEAARSLEAPL